MAKTALIRTVLSAVLALGLLAWLSFDDATALLLRQLQSLPMPLFWLLLLTQSASYFCRAGRLFSQFEHSLPIPPGTYLRISLLHNLSVNVMPFRAGELTLPAMLHRAGLSLSQAISTLFWLRIQDALVLLALAIALWPGLPKEQRAGAIFLLILGIGLGGRWLAQKPAGQSRVGRFLDRVRPLLDTSALSWGWCLSNWLLKLLGLSIVLAALGEYSWLTASAGALGGELSALLPIQGVAGLGSYEAGVAFLIELSAASGQAALATAFALHCLTLSLAILAGALAWLFLPPIPVLIRPSCH